jgi:DHA1 family multidrug resistance protein-like MFS transporter
MGLAVFAIQFGFALSGPYIALYINRDFGVRDPGRLALLTGIVVASGPVTQAVFNPIWGAVGDRFGRTAMVLRALGTSAVTCALASFVPSLAWLVVARVLAGAGSGVGASATAIVADSTPTSRLARSIGLLAAGSSLGQVAGPIAGGALAILLPIRWLFLVGGVFLAVALVPVVILAREPPRTHPRESAPGLRAAVRAAPPGTRGVLVALAAAIGLSYLGATGAQQLFALRLIEFHTGSTGLVIGITLSAFGLATAIASLLCSSLVDRIGYRRTASLAALLLAIAVAACAWWAGALGLVLAATATGAGFGLLTPSLNSMLGLEAPAAIKATIFGFAASAQTLGYGLGPLVGGSVAAAAGSLSAAFLTLALAALAAGLVVWFATREPPSAGSSAPNGQIATT